MSKLGQLHRLTLSSKEMYTKPLKIMGILTMQLKMAISGEDNEPRPCPDKASPQLQLHHLITDLCRECQTDQNFRYTSTWADITRIL